MTELRTQVENMRTLQEITKVTSAVEELMSAYVLNCEKVDKAREQKKSMLKAYQEMRADLDLAFVDFYTYCNEVLKVLVEKGETV